MPSAVYLCSHFVLELLCSYVRHRQTGVRANRRDFSKKAREIANELIVKLPAVSYSGRNRCITATPNR
jgi:hypothetical protein